MSKLENTNLELKDELNDLEQYSRRNCLLFHGIHEWEKDRDIAVRKETWCAKTVSTAVIARVLQILNSNDMKARPVIVKLTTYRMRQLIFSQKRRLKSSHVDVTENLTKQRSDLLRSARTNTNITSAWSTDGRVVYLLNTGKKMTVSCVTVW